jgi:hypothetical protein
LKAKPIIVVSGMMIQVIYVLYLVLELNPAQTVLKYVATYIQVFLILGFTFFLLKKTILPKIFPVLVVLFAVVFQFTLVHSLPDLSDDIYRYLWDGKLQHHHINPFEYAPDDPELNVYHSDILPGLVNFPSIKTIYPPASQLLFRFSYLIFGESILGMKFLFILFQIGSCWLFYLLLKQRGGNIRLLLIFSWNPLIVMETAVNGHLDIVMVFFLLAALYLYFNRNMVFSGVVLALSILIKLIPLIILPVLVLDIRKAFSGVKNNLKFLIPLFFTLVLFTAFYAGSILNMLATALNYSSKWYFNNPIFHALLLFIKDNQLAHLVSFSLLGMALLFILFAPLPVEKKIFFSVLGFVLLNPTIHPWYLTILLGLCCLYCSELTLWWTGLIVLSYFVVYRFKLSGIWEDNWMTMVLQYTPLLAMFFYFRIKSKISGFFCQQ